MRKKTTMPWLVRHWPITLGMVCILSAVVILNTCGSVQVSGLLVTPRNRLIHPYNPIQLAEFFP